MQRKSVTKQILHTHTHTHTQKKSKKEPLFAVSFDAAMPPEEFERSWVAIITSSDCWLMLTEMFPHTHNQMIDVHVQKAW
jgi:hypothetical protein